VNDQYKLYGAVESTIFTGVSDCCLMPTQQFFINIMEKRS